MPMNSNLLKHFQYELIKPVSNVNSTTNKSEQKTKKAKEKFKR
jgi:hypothetical protein